MNERFIEKFIHIHSFIERRTSDTKFREAEAEADRKKYYKAEAESIKAARRRPKPMSKSTTFECLEAEAGLKASIFAKSPVSGSRSRSRSRLPAQPCLEDASVVLCTDSQAALATLATLFFLLFDCTSLLLAVLFLS